MDKLKNLKQQSIDNQFVAKYNCNYLKISTIKNYQKLSKIDSAENQRLITVKKS